MYVELTFHLYFRPTLSFVSDVPARVTKSPGPLGRTSISGVLRKNLYNLGDYLLMFEMKDFQR